MKLKICILFIFLTINQLTKAQPDLSVKFSSFNYKSSNCNSFIYHTGSIIVIPEDAFMTEASVACEGDIIINYREIHHPSQMIGNNLNMFTFDAKGKKQLLESSGMFEIEAICKSSNKSLKLKKGKKIDVFFKTFNPIPDVVLWQFSNKSKSWIRKKQSITDLASNKLANDATEWGGERIPVQIEGGSDNFDGEMIYMTPEEYKKYLADQRERVRRDSLEREIFKAIQIDEMGLYNCDRIIEEESIPLIAGFSVPGGAEINKIYVVYRQLNTVIYYSLSNDMPFQLLKTNNIEIIAIDQNSNLYQVPENQLKLSYLNSNSGKKITFELMNKGLVQTHQQLALKTGIK
ncbi:MAG: hypothetical protein SNJ77_06535 [Cytophagales bacterium]